MKPKFLLFISLISLLPAQSTWMWSGRVHPELKWSTLETKHFNIHYHQGIEDIARQGASIAEQVRPVLLKQMELDNIPKIDIIFTTEDEIMNGFATWMNTTFIWVDQNDVAVWLENEKWLFQVIAHELQHIVFFNKVKTWMPEPWSVLMSGTPGWVVEGLAEYMTEKWRPHRADISHKWHVLKNKMGEMDPHHDGYSKLLYWADRFGDSTIVKTLQSRNKMKLFRFKKAFRKATGISVDQFNEDWRRHMNTYYYGYRAQKEAIEEIGKTLTLPVKNMGGFAFASDSMKIAIAGRKDKEQYDQSLYIAKRDTAQEKKPKKKKLQFISALFKSKKDTVKEKPGKPKIKWKLEEMDYGRFHNVMSWSPDGSKLAYAKYHFGKYQSMVWDIRVIDAETGKTEWITSSFRAAQPDWSPDGKRIVFVAHKNNTSNLYTIAPDGKDHRQITAYTGDTQLLNPKWSPDGKRIAFAKSGPDGNVDIYVLAMETGEEIRITENPEVDYRPVWHPDGKAITFTSHKGSTPNLHTTNLETKETFQNTDVGDAVWSAQWTPKDSTIIAVTLGDVDSVRIVRVDPDRRITTNSLSIRERFTSWRTKQPAPVLASADPSAPVDILKKGKYQFLRHPKHLMSLVFPYLDGSGIFGVTTISDAMGRHFVELGGSVAWQGDPDPWFLFSYINAQHGPLWGFSYFYNSRWDFRFYDQTSSGLYERLDGIQFTTEIPFNFGESMSDNHLFWSSLTFQERTVPTMPYDSVGAEGETFYHDFSDSPLPKPEEGKEGIVSLNYRWLSRRPHAKNIILPIQGHGVQTRIDHANKNLYGDFTYTRLETDAFFNLKAGGPFVLFGRVKTQAMVDTPPAQDSLALTKDTPFYLPVGSLDLGIFTVQETHNPRGWDGVRLGDRLVYGTLEYRCPLIPELPVNILGLTLGSMTGAIFTDFANAWIAGADREDWVFTGGYEIKIALQAEKTPLLFFSIGQAQEIKDWKKGADPGDFYFRLALINPF